MSQQDDIQEALATLYVAGSMGFHTSQSGDGQYQMVSKFPSLIDLQNYYDAWVKAMLMIRPYVDANKERCYAPAQPTDQA